MKRYRCIKPFYVDKYDEHGFLIENSGTVIEKGKIYELDESGCTIIGGEVHLDAVDDGSWLEITNDDLEEYFDLLEVE
jgi:hypothetical protein|uniref:Uncharacterized protein n=1 Tax=Siphoviridae sp. ctuy39 TaxID=2825719 RepID=A0A8S5VEM8_9CAUD|nr:MAG TPA: hypothetical protein [Siphoviridae sp. ctuy39]